MVHLDADPPPQVDHVTGLSTTSYSILSNDTRVEVYCR